MARGAETTRPHEQARGTATNLEPRPHVVSIIATLLVVSTVVAAYGFGFWHPYPNPVGLWLLVLSLAVGAAVARMSDEKEGLVNSLPRLGKRDAALLVTLIVLLGGVLRFHGIDFGLPAYYHPDERWKVTSLLQMQANGDFHPRYFHHPSLLLYSSYLVHTILQFLHVEGPRFETALLAGRSVSALSGTLSIFLVYAIGRQLYSRTVGVLASALMAVSPLSVTCSRYMKEDALLLFFILGCLLWTLRALREARGSSLLFAGLLGGFASSTKYSGFLTVLIVAAAPWFRSNRLRPDGDLLKWAALGVVLVPVGFVLGTPYSLFESERFLKGVAFERLHMVRGHDNAVDAWSQYWMYHYARSIIPGMTLPTTLVASLGAGLLLWRRRTEDLCLLLLILLFYLPAEWVKAKPSPQAERYILPCLPFLATAASEFLCVLWRMNARFVAAALLLFALGVPVFRTVTLTSEIKPDTRTQMAQWMTANLSDGSWVFLDFGPYAPHFSNDEFMTDPIMGWAEYAKLDPDALRHSGRDYLVLSSLSYERYFTEPGYKRRLREWFKTVFEVVPIIKEFRPAHGTYGFHNPTLTLFSLKPEDFAALDRERALKREGKLEKTTNESRTSFNWR